MSESGTWYLVAFLFLLSAITSVVSFYEGCNRHEVCEQTCSPQAIIESGEKFCVCNDPEGKPVLKGVKYP